MSVLIKGMEMPKDCFSCPLKEEGYCNLTNAYAVLINERNSDCPLVELHEKHGRMIDADMVIEKANHEAEAMSGSLKECFGQLVEWIVDKTPTVIEAEDGK